MDTKNEDIRAVIQKLEAERITFSFWGVLKSLLIGILLVLPAIPWFWFWSLISHDIFGNAQWLPVLLIPIFGGYIYVCAFFLRPILRFRKK